MGVRGRTVGRGREEEITTNRSRSFLQQFPTYCTLRAMTSSSSSSDSTSAATIKELIERFYYRGWNRRDEAVVRACLRDDVRFRGSLRSRKDKGAQAYLDYMRKLQSVVTNYTIKLDDVVIDSSQNKAAVRCTSRGIHKGIFFGVEATGYEVTWSNMAFLTVADGKISEICVIGDVDSLKNQIGAEQDAGAF